MRETVRGFTIPGRQVTIQSFKEQGGQIAAVLPIHSPRAMLRAFHFLPVEIWGPPRIDSSRGAAHLQTYVCSIARNSLSFITSENLKDVELILVPHACDSLQGLGSLLIDFHNPSQPVIPFYLPRGRRPSDYQFLADELESIYHRLESITGFSPSEGDLLESIHREQTADDLLGMLHRQRGKIPLTSFEFYRLIRSREYLPAESFCELANAHLATTNSNHHPPGLPIILSGIVPEPMDLLNTVDEMHGWIAGDDLACCARRLYLPGHSQNPFLRMAESLLSGPPDPTRGDPISSRRDHLRELVFSTQARGIIFYEVKFCEPELFDLPILRTELQKSGVRSLVVEMDLNDPLSQQVLTRVEAFMETIS